MNSITDFDTLAGKTVTRAYALHDLELGWLQQIIFQVEEVFLVAAVNADTDEVVLSILPEVDFKMLEQQYSITPISNQRKKINWIWRMTNHLGYDDGFQLEFGDEEQTNVQLIAEASCLKLYIFQRH